MFMLFTKLCWKNVRNLNYLCNYHSILVHYFASWLASAAFYFIIIWLVFIQSKFNFITWIPFRDAICFTNSKAWSFLVVPCRRKLVTLPKPRQLILLHAQTYIHMLILIDSSKKTKKIQNFKIIVKCNWCSRNCGRDKKNDVAATIVVNKVGKFIGIDIQLWNFAYLFENSKQSISSLIHEMNLISMIWVVVINSICNLTIGIKDGTPLSIQYKRFHP